MPVLDSKGAPTLLYRVSRCRRQLVAPARVRACSPAKFLSASEEGARFLARRAAPLRMDAASCSASALRGVLTRGGAAAAFVPGIVKDGLQATPDVATADAASIERVAAWLLASPWELRKCRSFEAALLATAQVLGHGSHPKPAPVVASVSRELVAVSRELLCRQQGDGLTLVRLAALGALDSDERKAAQVRLRLRGATLRVAVAVSAKGGEVAAAAAAAAAQRAVDAAELAATPLAARVALPGCLSAGQLIGKGGSALAQLQREIEQELDLKVREASTLAPSAPTRRALGGGSAVSMRVGRGCVLVVALVRLTNLERRAEAEARLAALCTAHVRAAAASKSAHLRAFAARAVAAAARACEKARLPCYPTDQPNRPNDPAYLKTSVPSLKPSRSLPPRGPSLLTPPALASNSPGERRCAAVHAVGRHRVQGTARPQAVARRAPLSRRALPRPRQARAASARRGASDVRSVRVPPC